MSDIKLFQLQGDNVIELTGSAVKIEKSLQEHIENCFQIIMEIFDNQEIGTHFDHVQPYLK